jgi:hypothetical protein
MVGLCENFQGLTLSDAPVKNIDLSIFGDFQDYLIDPLSTLEKIP